MRKRCSRPSQADVKMSADADGTFKLGLQLLLYSSQREFSVWLNAE